MNQQKSAPFAATCPDCDVDKATASANEVVAFHRRHHRYTGHEIVWTRKEFEFELPDDGDVEAVVAELGARYDGAVPLGVVTAAMDERGVTVGEALEEIHQVRMTGALYEPRDDHLAVV